MGQNVRHLLKCYIAGWPSEGSLCFL